MLARWCSILSRRRFGFLLPPMMALATTAAVLVYFGASPLPSDAHGNLIRSLLQVIATILGVNILGLTINTNQLGQTTNLRKLVVDTQEAVNDVYERYYNAHPREEALQRHPRVTRVLNASPVNVLILRDEQKSEDYYIYRPYWDGVWYQIPHSPFSDREPGAIRREIQLAHEATLCAIQVLRLTRDMRRNGCGLLSTSRGTNGSRWYLESLAQIENSKELGMAQLSPVTISRRAAGRIVNLAIDSNHYMSEELEEHASEENWEPHSLARFVCYFLEHAKWMGFLWVKLQMLRLARAQRRRSAEIPQATMERLGMTTIQSLHPKLLTFSKTATAEYGAANRFWLVRQAAVPGLGWAMIFLFFAAAIWPISSLWFDVSRQLVIVSIVYGLGILALLESLAFAGGLIWGRRTGAALEAVGTRPPT
jgi:hypothetical protein